MGCEKYWSRYFENLKYPCFVIDKSSLEMLYCNEPFIDLYHITDDWMGKKCYEVVSSSTVQVMEQIPDWTLQDIFETETYNKELNRRFLVKSTLTMDKSAIFNEIIPLDEDGQENSRFEEAMTQCIKIFEKRDDTKVALNGFTELLAEFYNAEVAYIYRFHKHNKSIQPITTAVSDDFVPLDSGSTTLVKGAMFDWFQKPETPSLLIGERGNPNNLQTLDDIMDIFGVKNVVFAKVEDMAGEVVGFVGVSNRRDTTQFVDFRFISTIARFVAQDVSKNIVDSTLFQLHYLDTLTGMHNREGYTKRAEKIAANPPKTIGVISVNVNGLKLINENTSIAEGDHHIKKSTQTLKDYFGYDFFRLSGDEFVGIAPDIGKEDFEAKVNSLHEQMHKEENYDFSFGHSYGVGSYDFYKLVQEAEVVMYINKQEYYSSQKRNFDTINDNTLAELLSYLENDEFMIYLQPQVHLKDGSLHGAEALIRRFDKTNQKMVFPDQFISLYEKKSVIRHVDMFVVDAVCKLLQGWVKQGYEIPISVNLSRVTLQEFGIVDSIVEICDRYKIPHNLLVIEVTERVGLIENNVASSLIMDFKKHGFTISLDDFGCAYSNIVTLAQIEVDEVKIDKSLVDEILLNKKNAVIVESVLAMCNKLENTSTLAEGIEDKEQADLLHQLHCGLGQGYYYSRPIPVHEFCEKYAR